MRVAAVVVPRAHAPRPDAVRLIIVGDVGEGNRAQHRVAVAMAAKCSSVGHCDAVLMTGDNFYTSGVGSVDDAQWVEKFEQPYNLSALNVPFYAVIGNHDARSDWRSQIEYAKLPIGHGRGTRPSARWHMPAEWYDVRIGSAHVFGFDTTHPSQVQASDMHQRVEQSNAPWKIVFAHHPRYTSGAHYFDNPNLGAAGMYALQEAVFCKADLFISGHDHDSEFIDKGRDDHCPNTYFAVSGAGSKVRSSSAPRDPRSVYFDDRIEGFAYAELTDHELALEFVDKNGQTRFEKTLTK
jgi:predicted phosphodiesterase